MIARSVEPVAGIGEQRMIEVGDPVDDHAELLPALAVLDDHEVARRPTGRAR